MSRVNTSSALDRGVRIDEARSPGVRVGQAVPVIKNLGPARSNAAVALEALQGIAGVAQAAAGLKQSLTANENAKLARQEDADNHAALLLQERAVLAETDEDLNGLLQESQSLTVKHRLSLYTAVAARQAKFLSADAASLKNQTGGWSALLRAANGTGNEDDIMDAQAGARKYIESVPAELRGPVADKFEVLFEAGRGKIESKANALADAYQARSEIFIAQEINSVHASRAFETLSNKFVGSSNTSEQWIIAARTFWTDKLTKINRAGLYADKGLDPTTDVDEEIEEHLKSPLVSNLIANSVSKEVGTWNDRHQEIQAGLLENAEQALDGNVQTSLMLAFTTSAVAPDAAIFQARYIRGGVPDTFAVHRSEEAHRKFYEDTSDTLLASMDPKTPGLVQPWMYDQVATPSYLEEAGKVLSEEKMAEIINAFGTTRARHQVASFLDRADIKVLPKGEQMLKAGTNASRNLMFNDPTFSGLFEDFDVASEIGDVRQFITAGATNLNSDAVTRNKFQLAHSYMLEVDKAIKLGTELVGETAAANPGATVDNAETGTQIAEAIKSYSSFLTPGSAAWNHAQTILAKAQALGDTLVAKDPTGNSIKATAQVFLKFEKLGYGAGDTDDYQGAAKVFTEVLRDAVAANTSTEGAQANVEMFTVLQESWTRLPAGTKEIMGALIHKEMFGTESSSPVDALLMSRAIERGFGNQTSPGVDNMSSFKTWVAGEKARTLAGVQLGKTRDIKKITPNGIKGVQEFIANETGLQPHQVPVFMATMVLHRADSVTDPDVKLNAATLRSAFEGVQAEEGFLIQDADRTVGLVPLNNNLHLHGATYGERRDFAERVMNDTNSGPVMGWITTLMYGAEAGDTPVVDNVINPYRKQVGLREVDSREAGFNLKLVMANSDGVYRYALETDTGTVRDLVPLTAADGVSDWVTQGDQFQALQNALGLTTAYEGLAKDEVRLQKYIDLHVRMHARHITNTHGFRDNVNGQLVPPSDTDFVGVLAGGGSATQLLSRIEEARWELYSVTTRMDNMELDIGANTYAASQGTTKELDINSERVINEIHTWAEGVRATARFVPDDFAPVPYDPTLAANRWWDSR